MFRTKIKKFNLTKTKKRIIFAGLFSLALIVSAVVYADPWRINNGETNVTIQSPGICKRVNNNTGNDVMVPIGSDSEYQSFINYAPTGIGTAECATNCNMYGASYNSCSPGFASTAEFDAWSCASWCGQQAAGSCEWHDPNDPDWAGGDNCFASGFGCQIVSSGNNFEEAGPCN